MANFFDKFLDSIRISDEDDDDFFDEEEEFDDRPPRKAAFKKTRDEDLYDDDDSEPVKTKFARPAKVLPIRSNGRNLEVCSIKPTTMDDTREICDTLLAGRAVILNLEGIHMEVAQRIIDFTSGACYSMNGNLQKVSNYIFVVTPETVDLSGDFQDMIAEGAVGSADLSGFKLNI